MKQATIFLFISLLLTGCDPLGKPLPCTDCSNVSVEIKKPQSAKLVNATRYWASLELPKITVENRDQYMCCVVKYMMQNDHKQYDQLQFNLYRKFVDYMHPDNEPLGKATFAPHGNWGNYDTDVPYDDYKLVLEWDDDFID